jgi:hypothetical protein
MMNLIKSENMENESTPAQPHLQSLEGYYSWGSQAYMNPPKFDNLTQANKDKWRDDYERDLRSSNGVLYKETAYEPTANEVQELRNAISKLLKVNEAIDFTTYAPVMACKNMLVKHNGDHAAALEELRIRGFTSQAVPERLAD